MNKPQLNGIVGSFQPVPFYVSTPLRITDAASASIAVFLPYGRIIFSNFKMTSFQREQNILLESISSNSGVKFLKPIFCFLTLRARGVQAAPWSDIKSGNLTCGVFHRKHCWAYSDGWMLPTDLGIAKNFALHLLLAELTSELKNSKWIYC